MRLRKRCFYFRGWVQWCRRKQEIEEKKRKGEFFFNALIPMSHFVPFRTKNTKYSTLLKRLACLADTVTWVSVDRKWEADRLTD